MRKNPRFFCDNCNTEVERNARVCPRCGRYFASIRCPSCAYTGEEGSFSGGCPSCGYSAPPGSAYASVAKAPTKHLVPAGKLPLWVYLLSIGAFIGVIVALIVRLAR